MFLSLKVFKKDVADCAREGNVDDSPRVNVANLRILEVELLGRELVRPKRRCVAMPGRSL